MCDAVFACVVVVVVRCGLRVCIRVVVVRWWWCLIVNKRLPVYATFIYLQQCAHRNSEANCNQTSHSLNADGDAGSEGSVGGGGSGGNGNVVGATHVRSLNWGNESEMKSLKAAYPQPWDVCLG